MQTFARDERVAPVSVLSLTSNRIDSDEAVTLEELHQSASLSMPPLPSKIGELSNEILLNITSQIHDAPSVVCFALTNKRHYSLALALFKVSRLNQICPKDVRERFPAELQKYMYNVMVPPQSQRGLVLGWDFDNLVQISASAGASESCEYHKTITTEKHLAFIRQVTWLENGVDIKAALDRSCPRRTRLNKNPKPKLVTLLEVRRDFVENKELRCYLCRLALATRDHESAVSLEKRRLKDAGLPIKLYTAGDGDMDKLWKLWNQPVIQSVEYLVLKELLTGWEKNVTQREQQ